MKILIGSKNNIKIEGARKAFENYFHNFTIEGVSVSSNVSDEPVNDEIYIGAKNRVDNLIKYAKDNNIKVDYYLGIESGIISLFGKWMIINIAVIRDKDGYESCGSSEAFPVPNKYVDKIINSSLGKVIDDLLEQSSKRKSKGSISFLTHDIIDRTTLTRDAFIMALTEHINNFWNDKK